MNGCALSLLSAFILVGCARESDIVARKLVRDAAVVDAGADAATDSGPPDAQIDANACAFVDVPFRSLPRKVDVLFGVDGSLSMQDEIAEVRARLSDFALQIYAAGTDLRVIVVARAANDPLGICIAAPFGSGDCTVDDSKPPAYLHVVSDVSSLVLNALVDDPAVYAAYAPFLRTDADAHFVAITDGNGTRTAARWDELIRERDPRFASYRFHAIVPTDDSCGLTGTLYPELSALRGGVVSNLCTGDFQPVLAAVAQGVVDTSARCEWDLPDPPAGFSFEVDRVNVIINDGVGGTRRLGYVRSREDCARAPDEQGWYFDDPTAPTRMQACAASCESFSALDAGSVKIELGCETEAAPLI